MQPSVAPATPPASAAMGQCTPIASRAAAVAPLAAQPPRHRRRRRRRPCPHARRRRRHGHRHHRSLGLRRCRRRRLRRPCRRPRHLRPRHGQTRRPPRRLQLHRLLCPQHRRVEAAALVICLRLRRRRRRRHHRPRPRRIHHRRRPRRRHPSRTFTSRAASPRARRAFTQTRLPSAVHVTSDARSAPGRSRPIVPSARWPRQSRAAWVRASPRAPRAASTPAAFATSATARA